MKKEKRIKKKLTSRQALIISLIIAIVCGAIFFCLSYFRNEGIDVSALTAFVTVVIIFTFCYYILLNGTDIELDEKEKALEADIKKILCTETFTELIFTPNNNGYETEMILGILKGVGCKFFAKLDENESIILIVYDKDGKEVWKDAINCFYFVARFKLK